MKKAGGYITMIIGAAVLIAQSWLQKISFLQNTPKIVFMLAGIFLLVIGFFLTLTKKEKKQLEELPIYEGEKIVGYRRLKK
ncbi:MAG: hypothetical protein QXF25_01805 [Candidatus Pacearchaeota archaeon]